ncbi:Hydroxypyruvate isomerase [Halogeometricum pallidum JCM 14848]|uniref:Hydroxypyruvate isomerase n=1 Tax=Halogeometricum pallidum JCM 14848 TaxID=1227487 RepID=M0D062_HALPD|nr:TIM barrel protein [Halogeometricum pallidum]ELZ28047.1 Hydroxypyruvate isomerase [Halogeometricum pallidum JCM 14848]
MSFTVSANANIVLGVDDPVDAVAEVADLGLEAVEFWGIEDVDPEALRDRCAEHGVVVSASTCVGVAANTQGKGPGLTDPSRHDEGVADLERSVELGEAVGVDALVVTVGPERDDLPPGAEHRAIVNVLRDAAPAAEAAGIDLVVEPLNNPVDHPGYYLDSSYEAYEIVDAVDSPAVSVLFDVYHQQITEGNVIENLTDHAEFVGYVHVADVPGRHEPGTGELNYARIFEALDEAGYDGYVGLEYSPSTDAAETVESVLDLVP